MAGTPFSDIYDQFMMIVDDYKLISLYDTSVSNFEAYLAGWLIPAITDFKNCNQSLDYSSSTFTETLTQENIKVLTLLMKKYWLEREVDDIKQMSMAVKDKDFSRYAESQNMAAKQKRLILEKEELSQLLVEYGLDNTDWANWYAGVFYVP